MPILTLNLTNRRFAYDANKESSSRRMIFDAQLDSDNELRVKNRGTLRKGLLHIEENNGGDNLGQIRYHEEVDIELEYDKIKYPQGFDIYTSLPENTFKFILEANLETTAIHLRFETKDLLSLKKGESIGMTSGSLGVDWDVEKENPVKAESINFSVVPHKSVLNATDIVRALAWIFRATVIMVIIGVLILYKLYFH